MTEPVSTPDNFNALQSSTEKVDAFFSVGMADHILDGFKSMHPSWEDITDFICREFGEPPSDSGTPKHCSDDSSLSVLLDQRNQDNAAKALIETVAKTENAGRTGSTVEESSGKNDFIPSPAQTSAETENADKTGPTVEGSNRNNEFIPSPAQTSTKTENAGRTESTVEESRGNDDFIPIPAQTSAGTGNADKIGSTVEASNGNEDFIPPFAQTFAENYAIEPIHCKTDFDDLEVFTDSVDAVEWESIDLQFEEMKYINPVAVGLENVYAMELELLNHDTEEMECTNHVDLCPENVNATESELINHHSEEMECTNLVEVCPENVNVAESESIINDIDETESLQMPVLTPQVPTPPNEMGSHWVRGKRRSVRHRSPPVGSYWLNGRRRSGRNKEEPYVDHTPPAPKRTRGRKGEPRKKPCGYMRDHLTDEEVAELHVAEKQFLGLVGDGLSQMNKRLVHRLVGNMEPVYFICLDSSDEDEEQAPEAQPVLRNIA